MQKSQVSGFIILLLCIVLTSAVFSESFSQKTWQSNLTMPKGAEAVFVDNGMLIFINKENKLCRSNIRGCSPMLDPTGKKAVFVAQSILAKVEKYSNAGGRNFGKTASWDNICIFNLLSGSVDDLGIKGEHPVLSPDGSMVAFTDQSQIKTVSIKDGKVTTYGLGETPVWISNTQIAFERNFEIYIVLLGGRAKPLLKNSGTNISEIGNNLQKMMEILPTGKKIYKQTDLRRYKEGQVTFSVMEISMQDITYILCLADVNGLIRSITVGSKSQGVNPSECSLIILNRSGNQAAYVEQSYNLDAKAQVHIVHLDPRNPSSQMGGEGCILSNIGLLPKNESSAYQIESLVYYGDFIMVGVVDTPSRAIKLTSDKVYFLADSQLDPVQLKMMKLDPKIAQADQIWQMNTKTKRKLFSGHDISVR